MITYHSPVDNAELLIAPSLHGRLAFQTTESDGTVNPPVSLDRGTVVAIAAQITDWLDRTKESK